MYNAVLADSILRVLNEAFPHTLSDAELKRSLPQYGIVADSEWLTAIDALEKMHWLSGNLVRAGYQQVVVSAVALGITDAGRERLRMIGPQGQAATGMEDRGEEAALGAADSRKVWVVHGRETRVRDGVFSFLRAIGLNPIEFVQARRLTGKPTPHVDEIVRSAFAHARAVVVLLTPDDLAKLRKELIRPDDLDYERRLTGQARPNVLFEAGMALASHPDRTVLVQFGNLRQFTDISGMHIVKFDEDSPARRKDLANRLKDADCAVDLEGEDWLKVGDLTPPRKGPDEAIEESEIQESSQADGGQIRQLVGERWSRLEDPDEKEAVCLLMREDLTEKQAIKFLNDKGLANNRAHIYEQVATRTNLVQRTIPTRQLDEDMYGYLGTWTINPGFKPAIELLFRDTRRGLTTVRGSVSVKFEPPLAYKPRILVTSA